MNQPKAPGIIARTVITAHTNADFDALAAMIAASKLYPAAVLIFPGSQEKNLRNFFIQSATYLFNFKNFKDIDQSSVETLVVVDTRQRLRLPHVAPLLERQDLVIHLYDHHPDSDDDLNGQVRVVKDYGSTTAILTEFIRERGLSLTPDEATFMGLGIYEDTGSFTFNSTTEHDLGAAAWLRAQGMDVNIIAELLARELSAEQITIMSELIGSAERFDINGVEVVVAQCVTDSYVGDFALLAHKLMDMENIKVLFCLALMKDRVHLVARSRTPDVDVGRICSSLGGGGHPYAASASMRDKTLAQAKEDLFALLYSQVNPQILAATIMSRPAVTINAGHALKEASEIMTRFGLKALPVVDPADRRCLGLLEHDIAEKAVKHGLGEVDVTEYMIRDAQTVSEDTELYHLMEIILGQRQRMAPVVRDGHVEGVVTRTDLINVLVREPARLADTMAAERKGDRNVKGLLRERMPSNLFAVVKGAGSLAKSLGYEPYVVGGFVRDLLLGRPNLDIDLVVEGDGIAFAEALAKEYGGRVKSHQKFKTAVVILPDGQRIDVATARLEYYEYPAALPTVELSSIKMDLYRRDFTINSLAIHISPDDFGRLVDFFGAQKDIKAKAIRVLHSLSFVEDPTRILRAIRFEQRFNFRIGVQTERLIKSAINSRFVHKLSGSRIFHEMRHILEDDNPVACIQRMQQLKLLAAIHPKLALDPQKEAALAESERVIAWYGLLYVDPKPMVWRIYFLSLCAGMDEKDVAEITERLGFSKQHTTQFAALRHSIRDTVGKIFDWEYRRAKVSELYFLLRELPLDGLLFLMARNPRETVRKAISIFFTTLRDQKLDITGADLLAMDIPPGPNYSRILRQVMAAKLDGEAVSKTEQLDLARSLAGLPPLPAAGCAEA
ncbi:CBS domain-containing protein [Fundidesulfovibrio butyratiphilus]